MIRRPNAFLATTLLLTAAVLAGPGTPADAQTPGTVFTVNDDTSIGLGGVMQPRFSWTRDNLADEEALGFGMRRYRLYTLVSMGDRISLFAQLEGGSAGSTSFIDLEAAYRISDTWELHGGRIIGAQPRAYALTLLPRLDAIDRPVVTVAWANRTLGADGRTYGAGLRGATDTWNALLTLHNGTNSRDFAGEIAAESPARPSETGLAASAYLNLRPNGADGIEVGGHLGYNASKNSLTRAGGEGRAFADGSVHLYWGAAPGDQPLRVKAEALGIRYEAVEGVDDRGFVGASLLGATLLEDHIELVGRVERMRDAEPGPDASQTIVTAGVHFSRSARQGGDFNRQRLTVGWSLRQLEGGSDTRRHQLAVQAQLVF
ncbi:MAG: hypothetical protein EA352_11650 [Gemmatimonadales bacterium]|nr:MAG: hypothetical protein EA352_11650 [Gemmatimonadales bacterium]